MDARVVDRATTNNCGGPQTVGPQHAEGVNGRSARGEDLVQMVRLEEMVTPRTRIEVTHHGVRRTLRMQVGCNPDCTLENGGLVNRGAKAASVDNEHSGF